MCIWIPTLKNSENKNDIPLFENSEITLISLRKYYNSLESIK
jgi:hypothetical protein